MSSRSKTSSASSSAGDGIEVKGGRNNDSSPCEESVKVTSITYDPPPASWFFARGSKDTSKQSKERTKSENEFSSERKMSSSSDETEDIKSNTTVHFSPNADMGMVSDNELEDEEHEGFNFIAISNSLLMAGRSFEHLPESSEDVDSRSNSNKGVLIVDGVASDGSVNETPNHNQDASVLTIPGSDSLPSDIGTICHHEEEDDEDDALFGQGGHPTGDGASDQGMQDRQDILQDANSENHRPLVHRFLKNLQRTRRLRKVSDASDYVVHSSNVSIVRNDDELSMATVETQVDRFRRGLLRVFYGGRSLPIVLVVVAMVTAFAFHSIGVHERKQREASELRLQQQQEASLRMMDENLSLRQEIELLMEEAAVAAARAEALAREQERLLLEREESERAEKERLRMLHEQEERKQQERQNQKRRRQQPWRSDDESFEWFFDDSNEECSSNNEEGSSTYTIADNCWIKAKADINLGNCGGETRDLFTSYWNSLWEDWDYYFDEPNAVESFPSEEKDQTGNPSKEIDHGYYQIGNGDNEQRRKGNFADEGPNYDYPDDTYYPPQDPLQDLFSVIHAAGESFVSKLSNLMSDEVESAQKAEQELEETAWQMYTEASDTVANAFEIAKEDMREMSKEALLALRMAVQKSNTAPDGKQGANPSAQTQPVTRKSLYDAATAVASLSKSWQEYAKSLSVVEEGADE
mmetsp:Transcript_18699/g.46439  ORF Transcript_18699/g.46439 Transcript_18699/m.46439 type:complete len:696 (-) Transcript_18699:340-2427(-)